MEYVLMSHEHVEQVAKIEKDCFSMPWSENAIRHELDNPLSLWIVALEEGIVVGYVGSQSVLGEADMMNLAVDSDHRHSHIGQNLVTKLVDNLRANGVHCLTLEVRASNTAAIQLYNKLGFSQIGRRPNYYTNPKEDALILRKEWEV